MSEVQCLGSCETELDQETITFEVSKTTTVSAKINFKKGDVTASLLEKIRKLEIKVAELDKDKNMRMEASLTALWDNEHDAKWDKL